MKKTLNIIASIALVALLFTSCKKDWVCRCDYTLYPNDPDLYPISDASKKDAKDACDILNSQMLLGGDGTCKLD